MKKQQYFHQQSIIIFFYQRHFQLIKFGWWCGGEVPEPKKKWWWWFLDCVQSHSVDEQQQDVEAQRQRLYKKQFKEKEAVLERQIIQVESQISRLSASFTDDDIC